MKDSEIQVKEHFATFDSNTEQYLQDYFNFLRYPSISTDPAHASDVRACFKWLSEYIAARGFQVETWETEGAPTLFASWSGAGADASTVLFYNHYDVQPVDPLELWESPPFEPTLRDGRVYARGAEDNKGQCFYVLRALFSLLERNGSLPVNVKLCIEGEEECGSNGLTKILKERKEQLAADHLFVFDVGFMDEANPSSNLGVRGMVTMTVEFVGSTGDLHSGSFGGIVYNPNRALAELLGRMWDSEGRVTIPGFYDGVNDISPEERSLFHFDFDHALLDRLFRAKATGGEKHFTPFESAWIRPALEINGVSGGYAGVGFKTVIPAKAVAKVSARIVPNQDPNAVADAMKRYFIDNAPEGIAVSVDIEKGKGKPLRSPISARIVSATAQAYEEVNGKPPRYILDGASIPIASDLMEASGAALLFAGYGLPTGNIHAPNENFSLVQMRKGFATVCRAIELLGEKRV